MHRQCGHRANGYADELRFEREQIALTHTGRLGFGTLESSLMHNTTETIGRTIPGTIGTPTAVGCHRRCATRTGDDQSGTGHQTGRAGGRIAHRHGWRPVVESRDGRRHRSDHVRAETWAVFAEDEWRLREDLALTLGARYDDHEAFGGHVSPRAYGLEYLRNWTMKGGVSRGYRTPDLISTPA